MGTDGGRTGTDSGMMATDSGMMMGTDAGTGTDSGMMMGTDSGTPDSGMMDAPSWSEDVYPILMSRCAGCHGAAGGLALGGGAAAAYDQLVDVDARADCEPMVRIAPGDPDQSVLFRKISGATCGPRMPAGGAPLDAAQIETIRAWIAAGAMED
jgi:hypothetical protein